MAHKSSAVTLQYVRTLFARGTAAGMTDAQLLEQFESRRTGPLRADAEFAFEALVARHGPMVLGVCRRLLDGPHDVEDAFQATFLVLARRAGCVRVEDSLSRWLYGVSYRIATRARADAARRRARESGTIAEEPPSDPEVGAERRELREVVDEELNRLPERYRAPIVLCHLAGLSHAEAARQLRWPVGTVSGRLSRGRDVLKARLIRRGIVAPTGLWLGATLAPSPVEGAVPPALVRAATRASAGMAAPAGAASVTATALARGVLRMMMLTKLRSAATTLLALGVLTTGAAVLAQPRPQANPVQPPAGQAGRAGTHREGSAGARPAQGPAQDEDAGAAARSEARLDAFARRVWAVTDLVLNNHLKPSTRPEMILAGTQALLKAAAVVGPENLIVRVDAIKTEEQLAAFLRSIWPRGAGPRATSEEQLETAMIQGLLKSVPGGSDILPADYIKITDQLGGNRYVGIGIQLDFDEPQELPRIVSPFRRGPAHKAGAMPGDLILEVDGKNTRGVTLQETVEWLRGREGTDVTVVVRRPDSDERRTLRMTRNVVPIDAVLGYRWIGKETWSYRPDPDFPIGYVWVKSVNSSTLHELRQVERRLRSEGIRALVLDFRFSGGGGFLHHAALVADGLLDGGVMWRLRDARGRVVEARADRECLFRQWPLVVLVNDGIDRSQAMVLAALQDHGRAILVGEPTKTDGYVDSLVDLPDGRGALRVRTGRAERAAEGRDWPLWPDHVVALEEPQTKAIREWLFAKDFPRRPTGAGANPPADPQLAKGLELLRAALRAADPAKSP